MSGRLSRPGIGSTNALATPRGFLVRATALHSQCFPCHRLGYPQDFNVDGPVRNRPGRHQNVEHGRWFGDGDRLQCVD